MKLSPFEMMAILQVPLLVMAGITLAATLIVEVMERMKW